MAIGKRKNTGDFLGILKWDARIGVMVAEDRVYVRGQGWERQQRNIPKEEFRAAFDMPNAQRGWINFSHGAPDMKLVRVGQDPGERPSDSHKEGIRLVVQVDESLGGELREMISTSIATWIGIDELHDLYLAGAAEHPNHWPVVEIADVVQENMKSGTTFVPVFRIIGWLPRPLGVPPDGIPPGARIAKAAADSNSAGGNNCAPAGTPRPRPSVRDDLSDEIPF